MSIHTLSRVPDAALSGPERKLEAWVRVVPYVLLVISLIPYLITGSPTAGDVGRTLAVAGLAAAWVAWWVTLHPAVGRPPGADGRLLRGLRGLLRRAGGPQPVVRVLLLVGYIHAFRFLASPLRFAGLFCIACLSAIAQLGGFRPPPLRICSSSPSWPA